MNLTCEYLILGAGFSGLACARALCDEDYLIIEARGRAGGRVLTVKPQSSSLPVELGPEFMHGAHPEILKLCKELHVPFFDVKDTHLYLHSGKLTAIQDFFERMEKIMPRAAAKDISVRDYIKRKSISPKWRELFLGFIEGFHAADTGLMGVQALIQTRESDEISLNGSQMFRPLCGYSNLIDGMTRLLDTDRLIFNTRAFAIDWKPGAAVVHVRSTLTRQEFRVRARKVVVTLPLGVLQNETMLEWDPMPQALKHSREGMRMGHVQKIVFQFRDRFWENLNEENPVSFLHTSHDHYFPVWWTASPLRAPYLTAWQGGPKAEEMSRWSHLKRTQAALKTLAKLTRRPLSFLEENCIGRYGHDWSSDPDSLGAYSYILKDGMKKAKALTAPIEDTIYFAGEALSFDSSRGTVHGAIRSGERTASLMLSDRRRASYSTSTLPRPSV